MTKNEAIFYIKELQKTYASMDKKVSEAVDVAIEALSEERTGEWVDRQEGTFCSECDYKTNEYHNFCPNCGAKMKGGTE